MAYILVTVIVRLFIVPIVYWPLTAGESILKSTRWVHAPRPRWRRIRRPPTMSASTSSFEGRDE